MQISFSNLNEFIRYVPNCLICHKAMELSFDSTLGPVPGLHKRWASAREKVHLKMALKDDLLQSKHKSYKLHIDPASNLVVEGLDLAGRFNNEFSFVKKMCPTCHFKIHTACAGSKISKEKKIPTLTLHREELHFTMRGGKDLRINKYYGTNADTETLAQIQLNGKFLPYVPLDFNKFSSFEQLVNRIHTIVLFH